MNSKTKKVATNLPASLLYEAIDLTGLNQTTALIEGLKELIKREKLRKLIALEGKMKIEFNVKQSRERR
jgi:hypothetical protein